MTARRSGATCRCDPASIRANSGLADYRHPAFELPPHERVGFRAGQLHRFTATRCKTLRERGNGLPKLITKTLHNIRRRRGRHEQPKPASISNPGIPLSAMVGMSGARLLRRGPAMAIPLIFPVAMWGSAADSELNIDIGQRAGPRTEPVCPCTEFPQTSRRRSSSWPRRELAERCRGPANRC